MPAFVGAYEKSFAEQLVAAKLPLADLGIEAGGHSFATNSLEAGTWFSDRVFLAYQSSVAADPQQGEDASSVALQYQLDPVWTAEVRYGDADRAQANVVWRKRF